MASNSCRLSHQSDLVIFIVHKCLCSLSHILLMSKKLININKSEYNIYDFKKNIFLHMLLLTKNTILSRSINSILFLAVLPLYDGTYANCISILGFMEGSDLSGFLSGGYS